MSRINYSELEGAVSGTILQTQNRRRARQLDMVSRRKKADFNRGDTVRQQEILATRRAIVSSVANRSIDPIKKAAAMTDLTKPADSISSKRIKDFKPTAKVAHDSKKEVSPAPQEDPEDILYTEKSGSDLKFNQKEPSSSKSGMLRSRSVGHPNLEGQSPSSLEGRAEYVEPESKLSPEEVESLLKEQYGDQTDDSIQSEDDSIVNTNQNGAYESILNNMQSGSHPEPFSEEAQVPNHSRYYHEESNKDYLSLNQQGLDSPVSYEEYSDEDDDSYNIYGQKSPNSNANKSGRVKSKGRQSSANKPVKAHKKRKGILYYVLLLILICSILVWAVVGYLTFFV